MPRQLNPATVIVVALLALVAIGTVAVAGSAGNVEHRSPATCFPAAKWGPVSDAIRPCVKVTRVEEDGSFTYRVSDANGTTRYTSGVGALDR